MKKDGENKGRVKSKKTGTISERPGFKILKKGLKLPENNSETCQTDRFSKGVFVFNH